MTWSFDLTDLNRVDRRVITTVIGNGAHKYDKRAIYQEMKRVFDSNNSWLPLFNATKLRVEPTSALRRCVEAGLKHVNSPSKERMQQRQIDMLDDIKEACPKAEIVEKQRTESSTTPSVSDETKKTILNET
jgi:hypothetical protein